jgi:hypothetical protein
MVGLLHEDSTPKSLYISTSIPHSMGHKRKKKDIAEVCTSGTQEMLVCHYEKISNTLD